MSGRRVLVIGLPFFGTRVAESLNSVGYEARYQPHPGRVPGAWPRSGVEILQADVIYAIGSSIRINSPLDVISRAGKHMLIHWVGTDVSVAVADWREGQVSERVLKHSIHRADGPWLIDELAVMGISARERLLPIPVAIGSPLPLPAKFQVLVYLPTLPQEDYDVETTLEVIRSLPDIKFAIVGGYQPPERMENVEVLGFTQDMPGVYRESTVLLRMMKHDGMSHSVIEAASFGRYVLWSYELDGITRVADASGAIAELRRLHDLFSANQLHPNSEGALHMQQTYNHERLLARICRDLDRLLA